MNTIEDEYFFFFQNNYTISPKDSNKKSNIGWTIKIP